MSHRDVTESAPIAAWSVGGRNYVLVILTLIAAFNFVDRQILGVLLEPIKAEFGLSDTQLGLLTGIAFAGFYATLGIPIAALSDRHNRRNIIVICTAIFSTMTALCAGVMSYLQLFLARVGVGIGEAGTMPATQSILSDLFPIEERPRAMGLLAAGGNIGLMMGLLIGGWVNEWFGWRVAFLVAAVPGFLLAFLVRRTIAEPVRRSLPSTDTQWVRETAKSIVDVGRIKSVRRFVMGGTLYGLSAYGIHSWMTPYYMRYHDMTTGEAGTVSAVIVGFIGGFGAFAGGAFCARMSRRDLRWNGWVPGLAILISVPLLIGMLLTDNTWLAIGLFVLPGFLSSVYAGPTWAIIQELVPPGRRAVAASVYMLVYNLIGLGFGPLTVGVLSDFYVDFVGDQSLRWAMASVLLISFGGIAAYFMAAQSLNEDLARVRGES